MGPRCASCQSFSPRRRALACMPFRVLLPCCLCACAAMREVPTGRCRIWRERGGQKLAPWGLSMQGLDSEAPMMRTSIGTAPAAQYVPFFTLFPMIAFLTWCPHIHAGRIRHHHHRNQKGEYLRSRPLSLREGKRPFSHLAYGPKLLLAVVASEERHNIPCPACRLDSQGFCILSPDTGGSGRVHREMQGGGGGQEGGIPRRPVMIRVMPVRHVDGAAAPSSTRCRHRPNGYGLQRLADSEAFSAFFLLSHQ